MEWGWTSCRSLFLFVICIYVRVNFLVSCRFDLFQLLICRWCWVCWCVQFMIFSLRWQGCIVCYYLCVVILFACFFVWLEFGLWYVFLIGKICSGFNEFITDMPLVDWAKAWCPFDLYEMIYFMCIHISLWLCRGEKMFEFWTLACLCWPSGFSASGWKSCSILSPRS